ncbi:unnamed protein product [Dicrocoelium dendriticum]|nr:unnamed protein product [Dicrocoelium dendriticum]
MLPQPASRSTETSQSTTLFFLLHLISGVLWSTVSSTCNSRLLSDRAQVPDSAFIHSSAVNMQHGAQAVRDDPSDSSLQERAWCPDALIHMELREYIQIDLSHQRVIKLIITKGRVAQSKGRQTTPYFYVRYSREETGVWFEYRKENGTQRLNGNQDAMTENYNTLEPPIVARFLRIYPFSLEPTKTCLKLELLGCDAHGVVEYEAPQGTLLSSTASSLYIYKLRDMEMRLQDTSYDFTSGQGAVHMNTGQSHSSNSGILRGGLGKLTDNDTEAELNVGPFSSFKFVGWRRQAFPSRIQRKTPNDRINHHQNVTKPTVNAVKYDGIRLVFRFDSTYNFTKIRLFASNDFSNSVALPKNISTRITLSHPSYSETHGATNDGQTAVFTTRFKQDRFNPVSRWIELPKQKISDFEPRNTLGLGRFVELRLHFALDWIAIGEVAFENQAVDNRRLQFTPKSNVGTPIQKVSVLTSTQFPAHTPVDELKLVQGQPTATTLAVVCSILAVLICLGLLCSLYFWRTKSVTTALRRQFQRDKRKLNKPSQHDSHKDLATSNTCNQTHITKDVQYKHLQLPSERIFENQTKFQQPQNCQDPAIACSTNETVSSPVQLYTSHLVPSYHAPPQANANLTHVFHPNLLTNLQQYPISANGCTPTSSIEPCLISNASKLTKANEVLNFLPLTTSQVECFVNQMQLGCSKTDPFRNLLPDSAIYTSLPGSDYDSQAYSRISSAGCIRNHRTAAVDMDHRSGEGAFGSTAAMAPCNFSVGLPSTLINSTVLPPPPRFPLPPLPVQSFSPNSSQGSRSLPPEEATVHMLHSDKNTNASDWHPQSKSTNDQASDYSSATIGSSSNNGYGAYYGTPNVFPGSHGLGIPTYPVQVTPLQAHR